MACVYPIIPDRDTVGIPLIVTSCMALLGLTLPGYALARALRLPAPLAAAFPLSALLICQTVVLQAIPGGRVSIGVTGMVLVLITTLCAAVTRYRRQPLPLDGGHHETESPLGIISIASALTLLAAVAFRTTLYPLGGFDTFIRWDGLAREMLHRGSLSFYPPVTGADFSIFPMPDGIPPLVASVYWWIYGATGSTLPQLTALSVVLQLASLFGLVWSATATAFGRREASFALLALTGAPLLIRSVQIGQESGFLSLAVAGQICFALEARRKPVFSDVAGAALLASLAPLAREYGPALVLPGFFLLVFEPATRRLAWQYLLAATLISSPWYLRNWMLTGTPLYPLPLPGSAPPSPLLSSLMRYYGELFGIGRFGAREWLEVGYELILGGSVALLAGIACLVARGRRLLPYTLSILLVGSLWLWSIGKTSGGVIYSMRVLAPALAICAVIAGTALAGLREQGWLKHGVWLLLPALSWSLLSALAYPQPPSHLAEAILTTKGEAPEFCVANREFAARLTARALPAGGILTDSPYLALILKRETGFRPVIIWSSEVSTTLDAKGPAAETATALRQRGIRYVAMNRSSIHNDLLFRLPLYNELATSGNVVATDGDWALFELPGITP